MKNIFVLKSWHARAGNVLYGMVEDELVTIDVIEVVKDAEDTYIVETEDAFYALSPPANDERPFNFISKDEHDDQTDLQGR